MDPIAQQCWISAIEKENFLRLKWFHRNETRLEEIANKNNTKTVSKHLLDELKQKRIDNYTNATRQVVLKQEIEPPPVVAAAQDSVRGIMRPVDPKVTNLIYTGVNKDGRLNYLKERVKLIPELRYYFPETSSFRYGWNMWDCSKTMPKTSYGRQQVIKNSFYRRRGVERDPDWYKQPSVLSPSVCR